VREPRPRPPVPLLLAGTALLLPLVAGCGAATAPRGAPSVVPGRDVATWIHQPDRSTHEIWLRNDSEGIYWIHAVILRDCMNVREACGVHELDAVVCPGESRRLLAVRARDAVSALYFDWNWDAERYEDASDRIGLDCGE
jgi:hypothetical protein